MVTIRKIIQNYLPTTIGVFSFLTCWAYSIPGNLDMDKIMDKSVDLASISFGFLLAVLALLLQGDNPALNRIKASGNFSSLVELNKKAVLASGLLVLIALIYLGIGVKDHEYEIKGHILNNLIDSISLGVLAYQLAIVLSFLDIFYYIIKQEI